MTLTSSTVYGNDGTSASGLIFSNASPCTIDNSIIAFGIGGPAIAGSGTPPTLTCSDIYGNDGGDWDGYIADQLGINGNICENPLFVDPEMGNFHLEYESPCLPFTPPNPESDLIGAYPGWSDVDDRTGAGADHYLILRVPNPLSLPFHATYQIPEGRGWLHVVCSVHDPTGRLVRTLEELPRAAGLYGLSWDGVDMRGRPVGSGVYYLRLHAGAELFTKPIVVLR